MYTMHALLFNVYKKDIIGVYWQLMKSDWKQNWYKFNIFNYKLNLHVSIIHLLLFYSWIISSTPLWLKERERKNILLL